MSRLSDLKTDEASSPPQFSLDERQILLRISHESVLSAFTDRALPQTPSSQRLLEFRGVFTTLYLNGSLRGCVGYAMPVAPLYLAVAETARAAAFEDSRFSPVSRAEAPELEVSLSVLSPLSPIRPEDVEGFCCRKFRSSMGGIAKRSSGRLATRPDCLPMPGAEGPCSRVLPLRCSEITRFDRCFRFSD